MEYFVVIFLNERQVNYNNRASKLTLNKKNNKSKNYISLTVGIANFVNSKLS